MQASSTENYPFTTQDIATYIRMQGFKPTLICIEPDREPTELLDLFTKLQAQTKPLREQCLINYQDHWFGLDIACSKDGEPISIVILDAANQLHKLGATVFLLSQIFNYLALSSELLYFVSEDALQRNGRDCATFAWEDLRWAAQKGDLHSKLAVLKNSEDDVKHVQRAKQLFARYLCKQQGALTAIDYQMLNALSVSVLHWIDYSKLEKNPEEWQMFFINTQAVRRPDFLQESIAKWLIEKPSLDKKTWVIHNIRISYCEHLIRAALHHAPPLQENEFIVTEICKTHQLPVEKLGAVLRNAVSKNLVSQVKRLLDLSAVNVNEVPQSAMTALDRAEDLPTSANKTEIKAMLLEKNAKSGAASSSRMHIGRSGNLDRTVVMTELKMNTLHQGP